MKETIFFALFESNGGGGPMTHDRMEIFSDTKTLRELYDWANTHRAGIERMGMGRSCIMRDIKMLTNEQNPERSIATEDAQGENPDNQK